MVSGDYSDPVKTLTQAFRKVLIGLSQTFGIPLRNLETYTKGVTEKLAPSLLKHTNHGFKQENRQGL